MAFMRFREPNHVKWLGVRPAHDGTQYTNGTAVAGSASANLYVGVAATYFFVDYIYLGSRLSAAAVVLCYIRWQPLEGPGWLNAMVHAYDLAGHQNTVVTFPFPVEIKANTNIELVSNHPNLDAWASIHGWRAT